MLAGNGCLGLVHYFNGKFNAYQRTYVLTEFSSDVYAKYLYYVSEANFGTYAKANTKEGSVPYIVLSAVSGFTNPPAPDPTRNCAHPRHLHSTYRRNVNRLSG